MECRLQIRGVRWDGAPAARRKEGRESQRLSGGAREDGTGRGGKDRESQRLSGGG